jgi:hypothetical protein
MGGSRRGTPVIKYDLRFEPDGSAIVVLERRRHDVSERDRMAAGLVVQLGTSTWVINLPPEFDGDRRFRLKSMVDSRYYEEWRYEVVRTLQFIAEH